MARAVIRDLFLCIGAQKAGTTWLARMLERHPDVFFTPVKEIHYFDHAAGLSTHLDDRKRRSRRRKYYQRLFTQWHRLPALSAQGGWYRSYMRDPIDDAWYARLFADRRGRTFAGEATPEYAVIGKDGFRHIRRLAPDVRLIYVMRNPVTRAWSQILHQCRSAGRDVQRLREDELIAIAGEERFEALADYRCTLDNLEAVFPQNQIWLGFYEDIHADRLASLERICAFIGAGFDPARFAGAARRYNISQPAAMPFSVRAALRDKYRGLASDVLKRIGRVPAIWREEFALEAGKEPRHSALKP